MPRCSLRPHWTALSGPRFPRPIPACSDPCAGVQRSRMLRPCLPPRPRRCRRRLRRKAYLVAPLRFPHPVTVPGPSSGQDGFGPQLRLSSPQWFLGFDSARSATRLRWLHPHSVHRSAVCRSAPVGRTLCPGCSAETWLPTMPQWRRFHRHSVHRSGSRCSVSAGRRWCRTARQRPSQRRRSWPGRWWQRPNPAVRRRDLVGRPMCHEGQVLSQRSTRPGHLAW